MILQSMEGAGYLGKERFMDGLLLLNDQGEVRDELFELMRICRLSTEDRSPHAVAYVLSKAWIRSDTPASGQTDTFVRRWAAANELFRALGFVDAVSVTDTTRFDEAVCFGGLLAQFRSQLATLRDGWDRGMRFSTIVCLGSARVLVGERGENKKTLRDSDVFPARQGGTPPKTRALPRTETAMIRFVIKESELPVGWECIVIDVPPQKTPEGRFRDPTAVERVSAWIRRNTLTSDPRRPPRLLVVSTNPMLHHDALVVQRLAPPRTIVVPCGAGASPETPIALFFEAIARQLQEEIERWSSIATSAPSA